MMRTEVGAVVYRSGVVEATGAPHGFSTRVGGVSCGMFDSLNLGNPGELAAERRDPPANIGENYRRILGAIGAAGRELVEVHQVHGADVHVARRGGRAHAGERDTRADAIVTDDPGRVVAIRVADCAPVLLASADGRVVATIHAGWRGVVGGVAVRAVEAMRALGAGEIVGAVGPCISGEAFEVGPEVVAEFERVFGSGAPVRGGSGDRSFVDLKECLRRQLAGCGVSRVEVSDRCTVRDAGEFYSHRREKGMTGRMAGVIGPRAD